LPSRVLYFFSANVQKRATSSATVRSEMWAASWRWLACQRAISRSYASRLSGGAVLAQEDILPVERDDGLSRLLMQPVRGVLIFL
jgi:hypothetical protein